LPCGNPILLRLFPEALADVVSLGAGERIATITPPAREETNDANEQSHPGADGSHPAARGQRRAGGGAVPPARVSEQTFYRWKRRFGDLGTAEVRELRHCGKRIAS